MRKITLLLFAVLIFSAFGITMKTYAQSGPVLYLCESYTSEEGEVGISDRFTTGYLTVMVKCGYALGLSSVSIQFDKYDCDLGAFKYYNKFKYNVSPDMKYIFFEGKDLNFKTPGLYRVFLLDEYGKTVTSGLVEIISK
ncbi:MAG: hypothetical protein WC358_02765 [Ignavibacteria bacterium]|jgi:hypothetical protein